MPKLSKSDSAALGEVWEALSGNMAISATPATVTTAPTAAAWTRDVVIKVSNDSGKVCKWLTQDYATTLSIADTSSAGTATIASTTLSIKEGKAIVTVTGDAADWLGGTAQVETITCTAGESTGAGNITMTITAAGMTNSPKAVVVPVALSDGVNDVGLALRTALAADADVSAFFAVSGADASAILTALTPAANDATLAFGFVDTDSTGVTFGASTNTTAGVAKETDTLTIGNLKILGYTVTGTTSVETFSA
jgi:hypothetical protein